MAVYLSPGSRIRDYVLTTELSASGAGTSMWAFAQRDGFEYFIKCYLTPVFPDSDAPGSAHSKRLKRMRCEVFESRMALVESTLAECGGDTFLVRSVDFFRENGCYFRVTKRIFSKSVNVSLLDAESILLVLLSTSYALRTLHEQSNFVHADIRPENFVVERAGGKFVAHLVDFDSGFYMGHCPDRSQMIGDPCYWAPEVNKYLGCENTTGLALLQALDIFSLGVTYCVFLTGELPSVPAQYQSAGEALQDGARCSIAEFIQPQLAPLRPILEAMLLVNPVRRPDAATVHNSLRNLNKTLFVRQNTYLNLAEIMSQGVLSTGEVLVDTVANAGLGGAVKLSSDLHFRGLIGRRKKYSGLRYFLRGRMRR